MPIEFRAKGARAAEILIYEDIGEGWFGGIGAKRFADELRGLGDVTSIDVRLNSYGGDVFDGLAMYQQLVRHKARVVTHVDGIAASIASVIAMAGAEIHIAEGGWIMVHDAWGMAVGNAGEMREVADRLEAVTHQLAGVYVARTGLAIDEVRRLMTEETWLDSEAAVAAGFATHVSQNMRAAARAIPDRFHFRHAPQQIAAPADQGAPALPSTPAGDTELRALVAQQASRLRLVTSHQNIKTRGAG